MWHVLLVQMAYTASTDGMYYFMVYVVFLGVFVSSCSSHVTYMGTLQKERILKYVTNTLIFLFCTFAAVNHREPKMLKNDEVLEFLTYESDMF